MIEHLVSAGSLICSQAHCLEGTVDLPLCARCTGIFLSFAATMAVAALGVKRSKDSGSYRYLMAVVLVSAAPIHALFFPHSISLYRFASGAASGAGIAILIGAPVVFGVLTAHLLSLLAAISGSVVLTIFAMATWPAVIAAVAIPVTVIVQSIIFSRSRSFSPSRYFGIGSGIGIENENKYYSSYRHGAPGVGNEIMVADGD